MRRSLGEPDPFRLRYRGGDCGDRGTIIREKMERSAAIDFIRCELGEKAPSQDRAQFVEVAETEVMSLHEGNFARYRVLPSHIPRAAGWRGAEPSTSALEKLSQSHLSVNELPPVDLARVRPAMRWATRLCNLLLGIESRTTVLLRHEGLHSSRSSFAKPLLSTLCSALA